MPTSHPKIMRAKRRTDAHLRIDAILSRITEALRDSSEPELRDLLFSLIEDYNRGLYPETSDPVVADNVAKLPVRSGTRRA